MEHVFNDKDKNKNRYCPLLKQNCMGEECAWFCKYKGLSNHMPKGFYAGECAIAEISIAINEHG